MDPKRAVDSQADRKVAGEIPGYSYGSPQSARSPISLGDLELLKKTVNFTEEDQRYLRMAGEVLANQTEEVVKKWRGVIAANPHLAQYSLGPEGNRMHTIPPIAGCDFGNGFSILVSALTIRIGSIISRRSLCVTPA
jgi:hypothetical protein